MLWVALIVVGLLGLVLGLLAMPVVVTVDAERVDTLDTSWQVVWLHGLIRTRSSRRRPAREEHERPDAPTPRPRSTAPRGVGRRRVVAILRARGLLPRVGRLAGTLRKRVTLERLQMHITFGCDNPADTGVVYGLLTPLLLIADRHTLDVECRPAFLDPGVRGIFHASVQVRPLAVIGTVVAFVLSPPVFRAARAAWRA
jgi:hypothetical protein